VHGADRVVAIRAMKILIQLQRQGRGVAAHRQISATSLRCASLSPSMYRCVV
jgi:hypothetical protein